MPDQGKILALDKEHIPKLLFRYAMPAIISMTAASIYNIADVMFIGRGVNALAIAGLSLTLPLMNISAAFGSMIGVGASTLISVKLGQRDNFSEPANRRCLTPGNICRSFCWVM